MKGFKKAFIITLIIAVLLIAYIVLNSVGILSFGSASKKANRFEGAGYDSPEKCIESYMEYYKNGDYNGMLSCYAIETAVDNFSMEKYVERLKAIGPTFNLVLSDDDFSKSLGVEQLRYRIFSSVRGASWYLADSTFLADGLAVALEPDEDPDDLIDDVLPSDIQETLGEIELNEILTQDDDLIADILTDQLKKNSKDQVEYLGSDDYKPVAVDFSVGKNDYYLFFDMLEYNKKWYISPVSSFLSAVYGIPVSQGYVILQDEVR